MKLEQADDYPPQAEKPGSRIYNIDDPVDRQTRNAWEDAKAKLHSSLCRDLL